MYTRLPLNARVSSLWPQAFAVCDRCGFVYNHKDLVWQLDWVGPRMQNKHILICESCRDKPQEQLRTIIVPADPIPIADPRPENYAAEVGTTVISTDPNFPV